MHWNPTVIVSPVVMLIIPTTQHPLGPDTKMMMRFDVLVLLYMESPGTGDDQSAMLSHAVTPLESDCCFLMCFVCILCFMFH